MEGVQPPVEEINVHSRSHARSARRENPEQSSVVYSVLYICEVIVVKMALMMGAP